MVIGRNDRGEAVGVAGGSKLLEELPNKIRDLLGIIVEVNLNVESGAELLELHVPAYNNPISYRGRYYVRSGSTLQELKGAAALLFHEDPDRFITGAYVKIGFFVSESELNYHDEIHGSLFSQAHTVVDLLRTKYMKAAISYEDIQRIERFPVPYDALREAVLNALVHRDYAVPAPIQIRVYENKLRIWNPAVLPEEWSLETLLGAHASHPYNPDVANAFFRSGEIESWGRGIERIFSACHDADSPPPDIKLEGHDLWVEFPFSEDYLAVIRGVSAAENFVKSSGKILELLRTNANMTIPEMTEKLQLSTRAVEKNIQKLQNAEKLKRIGPSKGGHWEVLK